MRAPYSRGFRGNQGRRWTEDELAKFTELWVTPGLALSEIGAILKRAKASLHNKVRELDLPARPHSFIPEPTRSEAIRMLKAGIRPDEVKAKLNLTGRQIVPLCNMIRPNIIDSDYKIKPHAEFIAELFEKTRFEAPVQRRCGACRAMFRTVHVLQETCPECRASRRRAHEHDVGWSQRSALEDLE